MTLVLLHTTQWELIRRLAIGFLPCFIKRLKDFVVESLCDSGGVVRVVIATVALGMGVDLKDINTIIHYGAPKNVDNYFQESGRGGCHGQQAKSVIFWKPSDIPRRKSKDREAEYMRQYLENVTSCRRAWLLDYFEESLSCTPDSSLL